MASLIVASGVSSTALSFSTVNVFGHAALTALIPSLATGTLPASKENGLIPITNVIMLLRAHISATTGAAPVPVPPPSPATMKTASCPLTASSILSSWILAHFLPSLASPLVPSPFVTALHMYTFLSAAVSSRAFLSVFMAMVSTGDSAL
ncbi:MAG: hypothetical protein FWH47_03710 [Methanomassiliicoccaceae archaeon]|nr:hypothetical protein [Methanomassiliicoccaceae archaeon]